MFAVRQNATEGHNYVLPKQRCNNTMRFVITGALPFDVEPRWNGEQWTTPAAQGNNVNSSCSSNLIDSVSLTSLGLGRATGQGFNSNPTTSWWQLPTALRVDERVPAWKIGGWMDRWSGEDSW
jgi:hypothetical protein